MPHGSVSYLAVCNRTTNWIRERKWPDAQSFPSSLDTETADLKRPSPHDINFCRVLDGWRIRDGRRRRDADEV